jgi:hypothetical protein
MIAKKRPAKQEKPCKCGARTPNQHVEYVIAGYPAHTYSGPKAERQGR